jgi:RNA polymerase sigma factor (sigma-70 family)
MVRLPELLLRSQSDERLASLARGGHDRAFATIFERYRLELLTLARRLNSDGREEDVLQQAFLNAFVALRSGTEVTHVRGWLYQIVRHTATKVRAPRHIPLDDVVTAGEPLEDIVERRAAALGAVTELRRLPERQRDALMSIAIDGVPGADVAVKMGMSEGAVRQLVYRARTTLRGAITAVTPWPLARWLAAMGTAPGPDVSAAAGVASVGGITAKVGALVAAGLLATPVALLPSLNHGARAGARHHLAKAGHSGHDRVPSTLPSSVRTRTTAAVPSLESQFDHLAQPTRSRPGRVDGRRTRASTADTARRFDGGSGPDSRSAAGSDTRDGPSNASGSDSGRGNDGAGSSTSRVTFRATAPLPSHNPNDASPLVRDDAKEAFDAEDPAGSTPRLGHDGRRPDGGDGDNPP